LAAKKVDEREPSILGDETCRAIKDEVSGART